MNSMFRSHGRPHYVLLMSIVTAFVAVPLVVHQPTPVAAAPSGDLPSPRSDAVMAALKGRLVLFGGEGSGGTLLGDTWEFDGASWIRKSPPLSPSPRRGASMALVRNEELVLFGGYGINATGQPEILGDTWVWDGSTWTERAVIGPASREQSAMSELPSHGGVLLQGGVLRLDDGDVLYYSDIWWWDGLAWSPIPSTTYVGARSGHTLTYDPREGIEKAVRFAGCNRQGCTNDTHVFDKQDHQAVTWYCCAPCPCDVFPSDRGEHAAALSPVNKELVFFGGRTSGGEVLRETWLGAYDGDVTMHWTRISDKSAPSGRYGHSMATLPSGVFLFGGASGSGDRLGDTWKWDGSRWSSVK